MLTATPYLRTMTSAAVLLVAGAATARAQTTIDGVIYASARYGLVSDSTYTPAAHPNNFDVDRAYLNVRSRSDGGISTRVTVDVDGRRAASNQQSFRLKYAYVAWTPEGSALTWKLGAQGTPFVGYEEDLWGYRMQGPVALDRQRYLSSSDFGVAVEGAWHKQAVNMDVGIFDGETYSGAPGDNRKDLEARVSVRLLPSDNVSKTGGLRLTGFALVGHANGGAARSRTVALLSWQTQALMVGAEVASSLDSTAVAARTHGRDLSLFATYQRPATPLGFMARVDRWDPDTERDPTGADLATSEQTRVIAGVSYQVAKNLRLLVDADLASVEHGPASNTFEAANHNLFLHAEIKF